MGRTQRCRARVRTGLAVREHRFSVTLTTLADSEAEEGKDPAQGPDERFVSYQLVDVLVVGPIDSDLREHPENYSRFFTRDQPPTSDPAQSAEQMEYAREVLTRFATRAFRQPVSPAVIDRLTNMALAHQRDTQGTFESDCQSHDGDPGQPQVPIQARSAA